MDIQPPPRRASEIFNCIAWNVGIAPATMPRVMQNVQNCLAELLWSRTTISQEWIAEELSKHSAANVNQQLRRLDRKKTLSKLPPEMQYFLAGA